MDARTDMKQVKFKFEKYNPNPFTPKGQKHKFGDCVIRVICGAKGKSWFEVYDLLNAKGRETGDFGNSKQVYPHVLEELGFVRSTVKREKGKKALTVEKFCDQYQEGIYILGLAHHLSCVRNGVVFDTWYPQKSTVYSIYKLSK